MTGAKEIVAALHGRWMGRYGICRCPAHDDLEPSLSVADGAHGRLLLNCFAGCLFQNVLTALRLRGLIDDQATAPRRNTGWSAERSAKAQVEDRRRRAMARRCWSETQEITGTIAEVYLRRRAIEAPLPLTLRFSPNAWHMTACRLPAMVAAVSVEGEPGLSAVHRTYLDRSGRKADVAPAKAMLGPTRGGAVTLTEGRGPLIVAEGIETALCLHEQYVGLHPQVRAALSTSGMMALKLPAIPGDLVVAPDGDSPGLKAAEKLARRADRCGWQVRILPPPGRGMDWNDWARERKEVRT